MATIKWVQGDTAPDQTFIITKNGSALDLTNYTVKFNFGPADTYAIVNAAHAACTITDAVNGKVTYTVVAGDTATVGTFVGQLEITQTSTGKIQTSKNVDIQITQQVA